MKIILEGDPISTNVVYRRHGHIIYMSKIAKDLKTSYQWQAKSQWKQPMIENKDVAMHIKFYFKDARKRDWDNYHKLSCDALQGIVYANDSQIKKVLVELFIDKTSPRIEIEVLDKFI